MIIFPMCLKIDSHKLDALSYFRLNTMEGLWSQVYNYGRHKILLQSIALAFEHCVLRVVTTCADFARDCDIQRDKSKDPFQPGVVYANFVCTQCSNASAIDCITSTVGTGT